MTEATIDYCDVPHFSKNVGLFAPYAERRVFQPMSPLVSWMSPTVPAKRELTIKVKGRRANFVIELSGNEPQWLSPIASRLVTVINLPEGWDSYGAQQVDVSMLPATINLLANIMRETTLMPAIVPTQRGGIQLEWHARGIDLEVEVLSQGHFAVLYENEKEGVEWEREFSSDLTLLKEIVSRLS